MFGLVSRTVIVVVMGQELYPLGTKVLIVLCQSESVIRQSSRSDTRDIRRRRRMKRECVSRTNTV